MVKSGLSGVCGWRCVSAALGIGAVTLLFLACDSVRPANAQTQQSCTTANGQSGTIVPNSNGVCSPGPQNFAQQIAANTPVPSNSQFVAKGGVGERFPLIVGAALGIPSAIQAVAQSAANSDDSDPFVNITSIRDNGPQVSSSSGAFNGLTASSRTTDVGGGTDAYYNASKVFNLGANQRLVIGGLFRYDSFRTTYGSNAAAPLFASIGTSNSDQYTLSGMFHYYVGNAYLGGAVTGNWGRNGWADSVVSASGSYRSAGYSVAGQVGQVFTLFDSRSAPNTMLPSKAPPRPAGGYALQLDVSGSVSYNREQGDSFVDSVGFNWGDQDLHFWTAGAQARLFATIPNGRLTWTPFVAATVTSQFGYSHTLDIPVQTAQAADTVFFGGAQTFGGVRAGLSALDVSGISVGIQGYYQQSSEFQIYGGQAFVRYRFPE